jgi:nucleotide-binding universal stress UspA family protein
MTAGPAPTYQKVLVLLDGSDTAEIAVPYGIDLVRCHRAELILFYLEHAHIHLADGQRFELDRQEREPIRQHLQDICDSLADEGISARCVLLENGTSADFLPYISSENISVVVMSTQGRSGMLRWLFAEQFEKAINNLPVPLLLVHPAYRRVIVPVDGSQWSERAIPHAAEMARAHHAEIILLHVYQSPVNGYVDQLALAGQQDIADQGYEQARDYLVALRNGLRHQGLHVNEQVVRSHNPAQAIIDFVSSEEGLNLVVMSTHGRTGIARWLLGSVAQKVVKGLRCPVTLIHPAEE